ncbi:MAG: c-type cytochrome [Caldilineaceae bacterium]|nr:c-type cytochrome [Caldilineaceae bacterium]
MQKPWYSIFYVRSPIIKIGLGILFVLLSLLVVAFQGFIEEPRMQAQTASWDGRSIEIGAELFGNNCASCHGPDGKGLPNVAPALHSRYFFTQRLADVGWSGSLGQYVELTLHAGRPSKTDTQWVNIMPTWGNEFGGPLRADQISHLVAYVLNWEEDAVAQTPEEDPWQFFQDALSKQLPYSPDEPGYDQKVAQAIAAAEAAGAVGYSIGGVEAQAPAEDAGAAPSGPRDPETLFTSMGCIGCHNLNEPQTADNRGPVGPNMGNLAENAANRVAGEDAQTYVHNSIVNPSAYVVEGYTDGIMPQNFSEQMSEEEINGLVDWLLSR